MDLGIGKRVAMIAASSKGLGKACAMSLAKEGCQVSLCGRDGSSLEAAKKEIEQAAPQVTVLTTICDVSKREDLERWYGATRQALGPIDILVSNTGGPAAAPFQNLSEEQWEAGVQSTLMNVVRLCHLVIPDMKTCQWGRIVNITSLVAKQPTPILTISSTLRAGLSGLTKTLAQELARDGITVNALLPGHILTDRQIHLGEVKASREGTTLEEQMAKTRASIPMGRMGDPQQIGDTVAFLCSERASYITGVSLQVDGGIIQSTF